jgi:hypothetical protein
VATRELLAAARGARLCYGDPVQVQGRTVVPVARVRAAAGHGRRRGGGRLEAEPVGFIDVSSAGARFEAIGGRADPIARVPVAAAAGAALTGLAAAAALRRRRGVRLPRRARLLLRLLSR